MDARANKWFTKRYISERPVRPHPRFQRFQTVDYEAEMVAIIGKKGKNLVEEDVAGLFGYCVGNDVTERMWQHRTSMSLGKVLHTCPSGVDHHSENRGSAGLDKMRGEWRDTPARIPSI